jgi:hypothetical protein
LTLNKKKERKKDGNIMVLVLHICSVSLNLSEKTVVNLIQPLLPDSDWPIIIIRLGGLLLVVSHLFAVSVSVLWVGFQKSGKELKLDVKIFWHRVKNIFGYSPQSKSTEVLPFGSRVLFVLHVIF